MSAAETPGTTKVTVLDEPFAIRSEASPEYTREVARHVDRTLRALRESAPTLEPFPTAVLGAMEITDELLRGRETRRSAEETVAERIRRLSEALDAALAEPPAWRDVKRSRKETRAR